MKVIILSLLYFFIGGCASGIPAAPEGKLYSVDVPDAVLLCAETGTGKECPEITFAQADKYFCVEPAYWRDLSNYISELIALIKNGSARPLASSSGVWLSADDTQRFKDRLDYLHAVLKDRRKSR